MKHPDDRKTVVLVVDDAIDSIRMINDALEEAGMTVTSYQDFSLTEPAEGLDTRLLSAIIDLDTGEVSPFTRLGNGQIELVIDAV